MATFFSFFSQKKAFVLFALDLFLFCHNAEILPQKKTLISLEYAYLFTIYFMEMYVQHSHI